MVLRAQQKNKAEKTNGTGTHTVGSRDTQGTITKRASAAKILKLQSGKASFSPSVSTALDVSLNKAPEESPDPANSGTGPEPVSSPFRPEPEMSCGQRAGNQCREAHSPARAS